MTNTPTTRKLDELGRVILPIELRKQLDWEVKDALNIFRDGDKIILSKARPSCIFCGSDDEEKLRKFKSRLVCVDCQKGVAGAIHD